MSHRYSREAKGKWIPVSTQKRSSPLRIPEGDNSTLIKENLLTIIDRVTNPTIQHPKAIIDYLPQLWNLDSRVIGRDLGPETFQFSFETEEALNSVLRKGPYHFKKWMLIIQRWEPIISSLFPSQISFWIKICGLPRHYSSNRAIQTIGEDLGIIEGQDNDRDRVRLQINGLEPLIMNTEIRFPNEAVITVEFEYEKLEKHCFSCFSLSHDEKDCPSSKEDVRDLSKLGINQRKVLIRMEADKRRLNERRYLGDHSSMSFRHGRATRREHLISPSRSYNSRDNQRKHVGPSFVENRHGSLRYQERGNREEIRRSGTYYQGRTNENGGPKQDKKRGLL